MELIGLSIIVVHMLAYIRLIITALSLGAMGAFAFVPASWCDQSPSPTGKPVTPPIAAVERWQRYSIEGNHFYRAHEYEKAAGKYRQALQQARLSNGVNWRLCDSLRDLAQAYEANGDLESAYSFYRQCLAARIKLDGPEAQSLDPLLSLLAGYAEQRGNLPEKIHYLTALVRIRATVIDLADGKCKDPLNDLVSACVRSDDLGTLKSVILSLLELKPKARPVAAIEVARILDRFAVEEIRARRYLKAASIFQIELKALSDSKGFAGALAAHAELHLGLCYFYARRLQEAEQHILAALPAARALRIPPGTILLAEQTLVQVYLETDRPMQAETVCHHALVDARSNPTEGNSLLPGLLYFYAVSLVRQDKLSDAEVVLVSALSDPRLTMPLATRNSLTHSLAAVYLRTERPQKAVAVLAPAVRKAPGDKVLAKTLARAKEQAGSLVHKPIQRPGKVAE